MWGNMPAINILGMARNKAEKAKHGDFNAMCAAAGDLHNVFKTVSGQPKDYTGKLSFVKNNIDFDTSARNAILLMAALFLDTKKAVPTTTNLWYSCLPKEMLQLVQDTLLPLIESVCEDRRQSLQHPPRQNFYEWDQPVYPGCPHQATVESIQWLPHHIAGSCG
jgi:hypothetical protein